MKTKIIWIIDGLGPGGAEQLMTTLLKYIDKKRFDMRVCVLQDRGSDTIIQKLERLEIPVDFVSIRRLKNPLNLFKIISYLTKHQPDIVHTQLEFADTLGCLAAKILGIPSVSTIHTIETPTRNTRANWRHQTRWFILRNFCTKLIAVSDKTREYYIKYEKLPPEKIVTIHNGIELENFQNQVPDKLNDIRQSLGLPQQSTIICTIAVLREQKGIQYMIEALPTILELIPNIFYLVVGDGKYGQELKSHACTANVENRVVFAGHRDDIPELLAISDTFVLPTLGDAFPTVLLEALAAKVPIIASEVGGVPEIITNEMTGLLIPPENKVVLANACLKILQDKNLAMSLAENGYKIAQQKFSVQSYVKQLINLYQQIQNKSSKYG